MPRGNFPWYLQRFEPVHCGRALCVHCTCTVRALSKHTPHTHTRAQLRLETYRTLQKPGMAEEENRKRLRKTHVSVYVYELALSHRGCKESRKDFYIEISYNKYVGGYIHTNIRTYIRTCEHAATAQLGQKTRRQDFCRRTPRRFAYILFQNVFRKDKHRFIHTRKHVHTYIHTYIQTYIQTNIHTYIHTFLHTYIQTYIHTDMHPDMQTCMHAYAASGMRVFWQCTHSARHSARRSARAENGVNSTSSLKLHEIR